MLPLYLKDEQNLENMQFTVFSAEKAVVKTLGQWMRLQEDGKARASDQCWSINTVQTGKSIDKLVHHVAETVKPAELWDLPRVDIIKILWSPCTAIK